MDKRRVLGPEGSYSPFTVSRESQAASSSGTLTERKDNRSFDSSRPISLKCGIIANASGSSYLECGNTKLIGSVYGPLKRTDKQNSGGSLQDRANLIVEFKYTTYCDGESRRPYMSGEQESEWTIRIAEAIKPALLLEAYPKSSIQVTVLVLEDDGSCLAHAITCASLALMDAGIEMRDCVVGTSIGFFPQNVMALDCCRVESKTQNQQGELVLAYLPVIGSIAQIILHGNVESSLLSQAIGSCVDSSLALYESVKECMIEALKEREKALLVHP